MFEAERRIHEPRARGEGELRATHRFEADVSLTEPGLRAVASLKRAHDRGRQRPGELRLPDQIDVAELRPDAEIVTAAARAQLAEAAVDPALLAIYGNQADVAVQL